MLSLKDFEEVCFNSSRLNFIRGGSTRTEGGTKTWTLDCGTTCSFDFGHDCRRETENGWVVRYCDISNSNC